MVVFGGKITQAGLYLPVLGQAVAQRELRLRGRGDFGNRSICRARIIEIGRKRPVLIIGVEVGIDIKRIPAEGQIVLNIFFETRLQVEVAVFRKIHTAAEAGQQLVFLRDIPVGVGIDVSGPIAGLLNLVGDIIVGKERLQVEAPVVPSEIEGQDIVDIGPQIRITDADTQAVHRGVAGIQLRGVGRSEKTKSKPNENIYESFWAFLFRMEA